MNTTSPRWAGRGHCIARLMLGGFIAVFLVGCGRDAGTPGSAGKDWKRRADAVRLGPDSFDGKQALAATVSFLEVGPRVSGTPGAARAASAILDRLEPYHAIASMDVFTDEAPSGKVVFRNVLAEFPARTAPSVATPDPTRSFLLPGATGPIVVLLSHFDTKGGVSEDFIGANDSGSSTGLLLEMARVLTVADAIPCHVLLAFVDGEECAKAYGPTDGLHGSRRLAGRLRAAHIRQRVAGVIVVDMIGDCDLTVAIPRNCSASLVTAAFDAATIVGTRKHFSLGRSAVLDDHVPFVEAGFRAVDLIDFNFGSEPGKNDYWHTPEDTIDKLSARSLSIVGRTTVEMINQLSAGTAPGA